MRGAEIMSQYKLATYTELSTIPEQCDTFVMTNCSQGNYLLLMFLSKFSP